MKICALYTHLSKVLAKIPSFQSLNHGYQGMVDVVEMYALTEKEAWIDVPNHGFHRRSGETLNPVTQRGVGAIFSETVLSTCHS